MCRLAPGLAIGKILVSPGRSIPLIRPTMKRPAAKIAPVFPAEKKASAFPSLTAVAARTIDESFFRRIARTGSSPIEISSLVATILSRSLFFIKGLTLSGFP